MTISDSNILRTTGTIIGADGRPTPFDLHLSEKKSVAPLVVFAHGYKGFKDWGCWNLVAQKFARQGFDFLKFNFSHNGGTVADPIDFPDLEAFARNTYSMEVDDLNTVIAAALNGLDVEGHTAKWDQLALIGHSRGGGISVISAAENSKVSALALWASVADFGERFSFDLSEWKATGVAHVENARTGQKMPHYYSFYEDYISNRDRLDILAAASRLNCPALAIHGTADEAVDPGDAERLATTFPEGAKILVPDAGHTFGGKHPWTDDQLPRHLDRAVDATIAHFEKSL
ncbi:MAG: alpha/beta hydrolase family protein [Cryomorphaceae bacterium]|nr:alpha/beta hydrolase [Flavobacteriales bacterium]